MTINAVVGGGIREPGGRAGDRTPRQGARLLGDRRHHPRPSAASCCRSPSGSARIVEEIVGLGESTSTSRATTASRRTSRAGEPNDWHCRAGARYLYVCEDGLVHWCSQQRGHPGIPLERYGQEDLEREYHARKSCAPFCTVGCVHRVAQVDELRANPLHTLSDWFGPAAGRPA